MTAENPGHCRKRLSFRLPCGSWSERVTQFPLPARLFLPALENYTPVPVFGSDWDRGRLL